MNFISYTIYRTQHQIIIIQSFDNAACSKGLYLIIIRTIYIVDDDDDDVCVGYYTLLYLDK